MDETQSKAKKEAVQLQSNAAPVRTDSRDQQREEGRVSHDNYKAVFKCYYYKLSKTLPTADLLPSLLSTEVITMDQKEEIQAKETSGMRACTLLDGPIWSGINSGYPDTFIRLLCLMRLIHNPSCEKLSEEISGHLNISDDVIKKVMSSITSKWQHQAHLV